MACMEISVVPLGTKTTSLSSYVVDVLKIVKDSNLDYQLTDMGTTIYGDISSLFNVAQRMHESVFSKNVKRVYTIIKIDDRRDKSVRPGSKKQSVEEKL